MTRTKSFQQNLFFSVGALFIIFVLFFCVYQYNREKESRVDVMHSRMQMYNYAMVHTLGNRLLDKDAFYHYVSTHRIEGMRVTLIDEKGDVLLDSEHPFDKLRNRIPNHLHRSEVAEALKSGSGYDIKRASELTNQTYFYSATHIGKYIVRSAIPYNAELTKSLQADYSYIWFAAFMTLLLGFVLYRNTSRIGRHIGYLREFAIKADKGEELDHELERKLPDDELGDISHTIITLYWRLRHSEEDKQRLKRQLTQNAAHELKTPAASIHGYLESILDNPEMPEDKRQHFLERCYAQSERMNRLLLDMSTLTKLDELPHTTASSSQATVLNVKDIITSVIDDTSLQLQEKGIHTTLQLPDEIMVRGDHQLIYSIFRNIIDNAIAYATGATLIRIECVKFDDKYRFTVSDNGQGVDMQHLPHLFERFYRVDKGRSRKLGGTGLGLAIVKNAVAAHGGTATAEPTPGGGLTLCFTLQTL